MLFVFTLLILFVSLFFSNLQRVTSLFVSVMLGILAGIVPSENSFDTLTYLKYYGFSPNTKLFESGYMWLSYLFSQYGITMLRFGLLFI